MAQDAEVTGVSKIADFTVLGLHIPATSSFSHPAKHHIYLKSHTPKDPEPHADRSLFCANIPIDATLSHFRTLFASAPLGSVRIENVTFSTTLKTKANRAAPPPPESQSKKRKRRGLNDDEEFLEMNLPETWDRILHPSGSTAILTFVDRTSASTALRAARKAARHTTQIPWPANLTNSDAPAPLGSARYLTHARLSYPDPSALEDAANTYMAAFGDIETRHTRALVRARNVPDADGFVTVTRGARAGPARIAETQEVLEKARARDAKKAEGRHDFYRFQLREKRKEAAGELVRRFADDRRRVDEMSKRRGGEARPMQ